jgi:hypothetical protein
MNWNIRPLRAKDLELSPVTDGFVASRPGNDRIHFLNPTAAFILESCAGSLQAKDLPDLVMAAFELPAPPADDVEKCLKMLLDEGLVTEQPSSGLSSRN